ncbi:MAG: hypothetical protein IJU79_05655 [Desulfovibrionaceae bacterium]|nr:hypothetical protein [Desulfovibrionaceae bacterium]
MNNVLRHNTFLLILVLFVGVVIPRLLVLGQFPYMDEGYYIYQAQQIFEHVVNTKHLPGVGGCNLYAILLAPFCALPGNIFVWLRLIDLVFALGAGICFYKLLYLLCRRHSLALIVDCLFLLAMNVPDVIQAGVKNSFFVAYMFLFAAWISLLKPQKLELVQIGVYSVWGYELITPTHRFFWAGVFTAIGVLLREPFLVYAVWGAIAIWRGFGLHRAIIYCLGGLLTACICFLILFEARQSLTGLILAYTDSQAIFKAESARIYENLMHYGARFLQDFWPLILLTVLASLGLCSKQNRTQKKTAIFCGSLLVAPFFEICSKIAFTYHFAMLLPALCCLLVLGLNALRKSSKLFTHYGKMLIALSFVALILVNYDFKNIKMTVDVLKAFPTFNWSKSLQDESNTLLAAQIIQKLPGKTLVVSGFMHFLYPATRLLPPNSDLDDLSRVYLRNKCDQEKLREILLRAKPDIVVIAKTQEKDHVAIFTEELSQVIAKIDAYNLVQEIKVDQKKNYGWIGCSIYQRKM